MTREPPTHAERSKANRLRLKQKQFIQLTDDESAWLEAYAERTPRGTGSADVGASQAATRRVTYSEEETQAASVGTGAAAESASAAAMLATAEGKRIDNLLALSMSIMSRAVDTYERMVRQMLAERAQDSQVQRGLLETVRTQYVARAEAEAELLKAEAEHAAAETEGGDGFSQVVGALVEGMTKNGVKYPAGDSKS